MTRTAIGWLTTLVAWSALAAAPCPAAPADDELERHVEMLRRHLADPIQPLDRREALALELAATFDRAAQGATHPPSRSELWGRAIATLDDFGKANRGHPRSRAFQLQAAVYAWADGRGLARQAELTPGEPGEAARERAAEALDGAIRRLDDLLTELGAARDLVAQNARYRLALALADRAGLESEGSAPRRATVARALQAADQASANPQLAGFAQVLRAELLAGQGRFDEAEAALAAAEAARPAAPEPDRLRARAAILLGRGRFEEARQAVDASGADAELKAAMSVRALLAERADASGPARARAEAEAFRRAALIRDSARPEARLALAELGRAVEEPRRDAGPGDWDLLADVQLRLGRPDRAATLAARGADRARELGQADGAAELRLRSGAILFQSGDYAGADASLSAVADDPSAGEARARAGLLRAIARGRALAAGAPGASPARYAEALEAQVRDFPDDPTAAEARWLLAGLRKGAGKVDEARALWEAIPPRHPRWLEARMAIADAHQAEIDLALVANDRAEVAGKVEAARKAFDEARSVAVTDDQRDALELRRARLLLTPGVGLPEAIRRSCERLSTTSRRADLRDEARRLLVVALVQAGRLVEAERAAKALAADLDRGPDDALALLPTARLLDRTASAVDSEVDRRRIGMILRLLADPIAREVDRLPPGQRAEARLRHARALALSGDPRPAREALAPLGAEAGSLPDDQLRDLADAFDRLEAYDLAVDAHRLRASRHRSGSAPWFEARYGMALAYYRSGKADLSRRLIDGVAILHPELGGGELRARFERLRQRLEPR